MSKRSKVVTLKRAPRSNLEETHNSLFPANEYAWTEQDAMQFLDTALFDRLNLLKDGRGGQETITDILLWVAQPMVRERDLKYHPTSFQACCAAAGLDAEYLQYEILRIQAPRLVAHLQLEPDAPFSLYENNETIVRTAYYQ
jgi:hypothetical protein